MAAFGWTHNVGLTRHEGDMAKYGFKIVLRFANDVRQWPLARTATTSSLPHPPSSVTSQALSCISKRDLTCTNARKSRSTQTDLH